jgi:hypothetical protein
MSHEEREAMDVRGLVAAIGLTLTASAAEAYVGPGLGVGVIGAILGVVVTLFLAVLGVVWYPLKRLLKNGKAVDRRPSAPVPPVSEESALKEPEA